MTFLSPRAPRGFLPALMPIGILLAFLVGEGVRPAAGEPGGPPPHPEIAGDHPVAFTPVWSMEVDWGELDGEGRVEVADSSGSLQPFPAPSVFVTRNTYAACDDSAGFPLAVLSLRNMVAFRKEGSPSPAPEISGCVNFIGISVHGEIAWIGPTRSRVFMAPGGMAGVVFEEDRGVASDSTVVRVWPVDADSLARHRAARRGFPIASAEFPPQVWARPAPDSDWGILECDDELFFYRDGRVDSLGSRNNWCNVMFARSGRTGVVVSGPWGSSRWRRIVQFDDEGRILFDRQFKDPADRMPSGAELSPAGDLLLWPARGDDPSPDLLVSLPTGETRELRLPDGYRIFSADGRHLVVYQTKSAPPDTSGVHVTLLDIRDMEHPEAIWAAALPVEGILECAISPQGEYTAVHTADSVGGGIVAEVLVLDRAGRVVFRRQVDRNWSSDGLSFPRDDLFLTGWTPDRRWEVTTLVTLYRIERRP